MDLPPTPPPQQQEQAYQARETALSAQSQGSHLLQQRHHPLPLLLLHLLRLLQKHLVWRLQQPQ